ncbi:integral peroxisomal membrane peroxin-domain-containing protein [Lipomyces oligophaga]|uniref:integral peroxisomal membrane peroxin-domain-containing protein n=1 Tax=Lipomyces oligophaga TaxID=45792 RepID=UPI0034CECC30
MAALETPWLMSMSSPNTAQAVAPIASSATATATATLSGSSAGTGTGTGGATTAVSSTSTYATFVSPDSSHVRQTSALLAQTPPTITRALSLAYPYLVAADRYMALITWTSDDTWASFLLVAGWTFLVLHWETVVVYMGHLAVAGGLTVYLYVNAKVDQEEDEHPTLDAIVHRLSTLTTRLDMFFAPITSMSMTHRDLTRLLFTAMFLTPVYIFLMIRIIAPRTLVLIVGLLVLTYHSLPARVTRTMLWRSRSVRSATFFLTGLDFTQRNKSSRSGRPGSRPGKINEAGEQGNSGPEVELKAGGSGKSYSSALGGAGISSSSNLSGLRSGFKRRAGAKSESVRFTYVVYENQRKWLGIGWTDNLLAYERTAWTDEFLNECSEPSEFALPDAEGSGMKWRWIDDNWRIDEGNAGDEGWLYYDNTWKKPSKEDAFGKYTRRRRWMRNAELVEDDELLLAETEVLEHPGLVSGGGEEDYKPELDSGKKEDANTEEHEQEEANKSTSTSISVSTSSGTSSGGSNIESGSSSGAEAPNPATTIEESSEEIHESEHEGSSEGSGVFDGDLFNFLQRSGAPLVDSWEDLKRRTLLRHVNADEVVESNE